MGFSPKLSNLLVRPSHHDGYKTHASMYNSFLTRYKQNFEFEKGSREDKRKQVAN